MSESINEIPKTYDPKAVEGEWYKKWEEGGYFRPQKGKRNETFCLIMPPPNVTGILHIGHALDVTLQDILTRYKRMKGFEALWLPGMDHAGIATQNVVEKKLAKEEGKTRQDLGRDEFLKRVWDFKENNGGIIQKQQRSMGASCDWEYSMFTLDPEANTAVNKVFVDLFNEGLIYQSDYIVNWDTVLQSAISDAEVEHKDVQGAYYHIKYKVKDSNEELIVATTRPETLLGDTAVAVNPNDQRFNKLIGKTAIVPLCNREVPIVGDDYVDIEKGTGCLKVTPGHDFNDFEIGKRHNLEIITILNKDGSMNEFGLEWKGQATKDARKGVIQKLKELDLFIKEEPVIHQVGHGDRSKSVIEPLVSKQWFLNTNEMARRSVEAIETEDTKFFPKQWENTFFSFMREPRDWCISRQLWWGHRIPVFTCSSCNHQWAQEDSAKICPNCSGETLVQDPDVLDTWFSSALWPFSTLGWPIQDRSKSRGLERFFPTSVLVTGYDIIFFWVARMMMMSFKFQEKKPFDDVYIHAIVRDKQGRKMSKSLGNGIDPLQVCEEFGADALRYTLAAGSGYNRNLNLDPAHIEGNRNFINKLWNAFRFIAPSLEKADKITEETLPYEQLDIHEQWILSELNNVAKTMNESIDIYRFDDACSEIYQFTYDKYCSWFIELSKSILYGEDQEKKKQRINILNYSFKTMLKLLHPVAPYVTEEIWNRIKDTNEDLLISQEYPEYKEIPVSKETGTLMNEFINLVSSVRNLRQSVNLSPKEEISLYFENKNPKFAQFLDNQKEFLGSLARVSDLKIISPSDEKPQKSLVAALPVGNIIIPLEGIIDLNEQIKKIKKDLEKNKKDFEKFSKKLGNEKFLNNAKPEIIEETKEKAEKYRVTVESLEEKLKSFEG